MLLNIFNLLIPKLEVIVLYAYFRIISCSLLVGNAFEKENSYASPLTL